MERFDANSIFAMAGAGSAAEADNSPKTVQYKTQTMAARVFMELTSRCGELADADVSREELYQELNSGGVSAGK